MRSILLIAALAMLAGCAGNPYQPTHQMPMTDEQKAQALAESQKKADIIRKLPPDADLENLAEQIRLQELGQYVDIHGNRRSLNEQAAPSAAPASTRSAKPKPEAPRPVRRAPARVQEESISFDPLPPPIDILGTGSRH